MIEVGEYVRTKSGEIGIFKKYAEEGVQQWFTMLQNGTLYTTATRAIVNHSKNIIDLIEVGDYVNGHKIIMDLKQSRKHYDTIDCFVTARGYTFEENEIETILTKEQYIQNCYKIDTN